MKNLQEILNSLFNWIYRLMIANFLWVFFSLYGFILAGVFPSTSALFAICRKWLKGEEFNIYKTFKYYYEKDFKNTNILGYAMLCIIIILMLDYMYFSAGSSVFDLYMSYLFIFLFIFMLISFTVMYFIYNHYELSLKDNLKFILIYPFSNLIMSVVLAVLLFIVMYFIYVYIPPFSMFLGISLPILVTVYITNISFNSITKKQISLSYQ
ncbi:DUF624 domain-containing protein [Clostridium sp. CCUG 7971]|uniref:YesL family protein n=1 Tax=Clostridium sp. CCUG 7971 TaxID=2811414 RepID=UPI001ABB0728|nr:DUF624 domain-containing protein [Clostridium sp. CCUG 7971]MBO3445469.1 DUF624 domain-containing protein [Clostridium sp. CCUG 7971]